MSTGINLHTLCINYNAFCDDQVEFRSARKECKTAQKAFKAAFRASPIYLESLENLTSGPSPMHHKILVKGRKLLGGECHVFHKSEDPGSELLRAARAFSSAREALEATEGFKAKLALKRAVKGVFNSGEALPEGLEGKGGERARAWLEYYAKKVS